MKSLTKAVALAGALLCIVPFAACGNAEKEVFEPAQIAPLPEQALLPQTDETDLWRNTETPETEIPPETPNETPPETEVPPETPSCAQYIRVLANGLNVRAGARVNFKSLGLAEQGVLLEYAGHSGNWYETRYCGKTAYVSADTRYTTLEKLDTGNEKVEKVIAEGTKLLGTPYVYGAVRLHDGKGNLLKNFTATQFDCSSLMQYIFYRGAGVLLDVNTRTQIKQGEKVPADGLRRGDLLFFTNAARKDKTGIERVGHVALYLGGNYILHTASDFAKIEQITPLRKSYFLEGRRI